MQENAIFHRAACLVAGYQVYFVIGISLKGKVMGSIVVVDDHPLMRMAVRVMLKGKGTASWLKPIAVLTRWRSFVNYCLNLSYWI